eukprot:g6502.t1
MVVVLACVVIDLMGLSLTIPILANFARLVQGDAKGCPPVLGIVNESLRQQQLMSDECQKSIQEIKANTGVLSTAYAAASFISTLWMPIFSDKFGRRAAIIISIFGSFFGFLGQAVTCPLAESTSVPCTGIAGGFYFLVFIRFFGGLFGGTATVASAFVVDLYPQKERGKQFAKIGVSAISAFTLGPSIGGGLSQFGLRVPLFVASGFSLLAIVAAYFYVHNAEDLGINAAVHKKNDDVAKPKNVELLPTEENNNDNGKGNPSVGIKMEGENAGDEEKNVKRDNGPAKKTFVAWKEIRVWIISSQTFCTTMAFNGVSSLMALLLLEPRLGVVRPQDSVEIQGRKVGLWVSAFVPTLALTQMFVLMMLFPKVEKRLGLLMSGSIGCIIMGVALFLLPYWPSAPFIFITQILLAIGNGLSTNVSNTYLAKFASKDNAAQILAWGTRADTVGNIIGPFLTYFYLINSTIPFWIAASFGWLGAVSCFVLLTLRTHDLHKENKVKKLQRDSAAVQSRKEHAANMKKMREQREKARMENAKILRTKIHPAFFKGLYGEYAEQMAELSDHLFQELKSKNHTYMIASGVESIRRQSITAHKDLISKAINDIPAPSDEDDDKAFLEGVGIFLAESGHEDWALSLPGITPETMINLLKTPH